MIPSSAEHVLSLREGGAHPLDRGEEFTAWLLPRIVSRTVDGVRAFHGRCRLHRWLSNEATCVQDVPRCPQCALDADGTFAADRKRYDAAEADGLL